jgi:hypothetical protein
MAKKTFIWKGPPTSVEVWSEPHGPDAAPIFSGQVTTGREIPAPLPEDNSLIASWRAFGLIEEAPAAAAKPGAEKKKENADG